MKRLVSLLLLLLLPACSSPEPAPTAEPQQPAPAQQRPAPAEQEPAPAPPQTPPPQTPPPQTSPPARPDDPARREADFAMLLELEEDVRRMPEGNPMRRRVLSDLIAADDEFIRAHGAVAPPEQIGRAVASWIHHSSGRGDQAEVMARLPALKALANLPDEVRQTIEGLEAAARIRPGEPAPDWSAVDVATGARVTLAGLRGKLVLVDFWATWCPPCIALDHEELVPLHQRHGADPRVALVSLGLPWNGETAAQELAFAKEHGLAWTLAFDADGAAGRTYGVSAIPFLVLVDEEGKILAAGDGWDVIESVKRILASRLGPTAQPPR